MTRLIHLVVETGSLTGLFPLCFLGLVIVSHRFTAITATVDLVLFLAFSHTAYHAAVALTLAKLYSNSMLVILNSRMRIRGARGSRGESETGVSGAVEQTSMDFATRRSALNTTRTGIHIHETRWSDAEEIALEERVRRIRSPHPTP